MFSQLCDMKMKHFNSFSECVDEFFSKLQMQKADIKALNAEKEAMKKLNNVIKDHQVLVCCFSFIYESYCNCERKIFLLLHKMYF